MAERSRSGAWAVGEGPAGRSCRCAIGIFTSACLTASLFGCSSGNVTSAQPDGAAPADALVGALLDGGALLDARATPVGSTDGGTTPEDYWLDKVGIGPAQTARVCGRGHADPVARALCAASARVTGLRDLYRALDFPVEPTLDHVAIANVSSGLAFRTVSALNPRVFAMTPTLSLDTHAKTVGLAVTAFTRGEQLVELFGQDPTTNVFYFYLFAFKQGCNDPGCKPQDLLGPAIETDWQSWTLYEADDLVDTPLDCLSCHQPDGAGTNRRLLMRDFEQPWFHWFPESSELYGCINDAVSREELTIDLRPVFRHAHPEGYAAFGAEPFGVANGHNLHSFIVRMNTAFGVDPLFPLGEPSRLPSRTVLSEWTCEGRTDTWRDYRRDLLLDRGFPAPSFAIESLDPVRAAPAYADFPRFLKLNEEADAFELMANLLSDEHQRNVGALPDSTLDGPGILREMCIRCHDGRAPATSTRAQFDARALTPATAARALERIDLPPRSPYIMPPRRAGALPNAERALVRTVLKAAVAQTQ